MIDTTAKLMDDISMSVQSGTGNLEPASPKNRSSRRKKLWQIDARFHCSVIGTCLTLEELWQICRKAKISIKVPSPDYDVHRAFVSIAGASTYPSRLVHKHVDRKYQRTIQQCAKIRSAEALRTLWQEAVETGEVAGAYWVLATHPATPDDLLDQAYGEIHMLSHLAGASSRVDIQAFAVLRARAKDLEKQLADAMATTRCRLREKDELIGALNARLARALGAERKLQEVQARLEALENDPISNQLRTQTEELSAKLALERARAERAETTAEDWEQFAVCSEDRNRRLARQLAEARRERDVLEASLSRLLSQNYQGTCGANGSQACPNTDLCGRCILYVGGKTGQCAHFRALVERHNGRFIHHDGGREDGRLRLGSILSQADAVLCPLDCVSHDAVNRVKRFCERHTKPLVLLPRSSLSAFAWGLNEVAA